MAEVIAQLNRVRLAPRKVRAVANLIKGRSINDALGQMEYTIKKPALSLIKLLNSAVANAENNMHMVKDNLFIKDIIIDEGIKLKRFMPKAFGRAGLIQKKTSHIKIVLAEKVPGLKRAPAHKHQEEKKTVSEKEEKMRFSEEKKPEVKREIGKKPSKIGFVKRFFQRKAI